MSSLWFYFFLKFQIDKWFNKQEYLIISDKVAIYVMLCTKLHTNKVVQVITQYTFMYDIYENVLESR